jgi:hypothetical protein
VSARRSGTGWIIVLALVVVAAVPASFEWRYRRIAVEEGRLFAEERARRGEFAALDQGLDSCRREMAPLPADDPARARASARYDELLARKGELNDTIKRELDEYIRLQIRKRAMESRSIEVTILGHTFRLGIF